MKSDTWILNPVRMKEEQLQLYVYNSMNSS
jgi:hypothetical protein